MVVIGGDKRIDGDQAIAAGDTNADVLLYMRERYGDFVLLEPRLTGTEAAMSDVESRHVGLRRALHDELEARAGVLAPT